MSIEKIEAMDFWQRLQKAVDKKIEGKAKWVKLAKASGVSTTTISAMKKGGEPRIGTIAKIAEALEVTTDWLIYGKGEQPINETTKKLDQLMNGLTDEQKQEILKMAEEKNELNNLRKNNHKSPSKN